MTATVIARAGFSDSAEHVIRAARAAAPDDPELLYLEALARVRLSQPDFRHSAPRQIPSGRPDFGRTCVAMLQLRALAGHPAFQRTRG